METIGTASLDATVVGHLAWLDYGRLSASTVQATKCLILDTLGALIAGQSAEGCGELRTLVEKWGGAQEARVMGSDARVPAHHAALVNSTMARALEIDDVHERALLHSTVTMVPVSLAAVDARPGPSGADLIAAVAGGIDLAARLSLAPRVNVGAGHRPRPMSWTYQTGILVGALVAGKLAGLGPDELRNVLGIAYSQCAGNNQCLLEGALTVRVQQGLSAQAALMSLALHEIGITGTLDSLSGQHGYFNAFHQGDFDPTVIVDGLGERSEVEQVSIKPFPCCKFTHTAIAAALEARSEPQFSLEDISEVVVHVDNAEYFQVVCEPVNAQARRSNLIGERGWVHAQFSLPYTVASALVRGRVTLSDFEEEARADEQVLRVMDLVETRLGSGSHLGRVLPTPGVIDIVLRDGTHIGARVDYPKGHPDNPMSFAEVVEKFRSVTLAAARGGQFSPDVVIEAVSTLEAAPDARILMDAALGGSTALGD
jgi:2-methylcitrate dehydratase PrpD